jgi:hypothetical protein
MIPNNIRESEFFRGFRDLVGELSREPESVFVAKWAAVEKEFDQPWLSETSKFNIDSWLVECALEEFSSLRLFGRKKVQALFFQCNDYLRNVGDYVEIEKGPLAGRAKVTRRRLTRRGGLLLTLRYGLWKTREWEFFD